MDCPVSPSLVRPAAITVIAVFQLTLTELPSEEIASCRVQSTQELPSRFRSPTMAQPARIVPQSASAQFPGCALSCSTLLNAQNVCIPPTQPQSSQIVYDQCFCNSAFLTPLTTTTDQVCITECPLLADRQLLQAWYNSFCAQVRNGVDPTTVTSTSSVPTKATVTATASTGTDTVVATVTSTSSSSADGTSQNQGHNQSWIGGHWKYIMMIAIIIVGLLLLAWLAVWLKKRHRRGLERQRAQASGFGYDPETRPANDPRRSATPDLWGPHQMMQATKGYGYAPELVAGESGRNSAKYRGAESAKTRAKDAIGIADIDKQLRLSRPSSQRTRPSELEINARMIGAADRRSKSRGKRRGSSQPPADKAMEARQPSPKLEEDAIRQEQEKT